MENQEPTSTVNSDINKKIKKRGFKYNHPVFFVLLIVVFILCLFLASGLLSYKFEPKSGYLKTMTNIVPYPAAVVNGDFVRMNNFYEEVRVLENLVEKQQPLTPELSEKIRADILDKMIHDKIIMQLVKKFNVKLKDEDIEAEKEKILSEIGGTREEVDEKLQETYGWDFDTFFEKVIKISVYQEKVREKYFEDKDVFKQAEKQTKEVLKLVQKGDESFQDLAKKYSQDTRFSALGGEWGWISKGVLPVEVEEIVFAMEKGDVSDMIKTNQGYHIVTITDKRDNGEPEVFLYDIFIKIPDFEEFLRDYLAESKVYKMVK